MTAVRRDHVSVCICTYHRNALLERLLRNLAKQETSGRFDVSVVIVDNDATGPAREPVRRLGAELGLDVTYDVEPVRTITAARNHALRLSRGNYIGIIDDDEFPPHDWLLTMYSAIQTFDVDGALGPVHPFFDGDPPAWLLRKRFSGAPAFRTGTLLSWQQTYTGNVLLKREVFETHNLRFNEEYKTGGSDQVFFKDAMSAGYRFVAVEDAPVYEVVTPERWTKTYYVKRSLVNGYNAYKGSKSHPWSVARGFASVKSAVVFVVCLGALPFASLMGEHVLVSFLERGGYHMSRSLAVFGIELWKKRDF